MKTFKVSVNDSSAMKIAKQKARSAIKKVYQRQLRENLTPAELFLWEALRDKQLGENFTAQAVVHGFIPDFWCSRLRIIVEADGGIHQQQKSYDLWRDSILESQGIVILRFSNEQIFTDRKGCISVIQRTVRHRSKLVKPNKNLTKKRACANA